MEERESENAVPVDSLLFCRRWEMSSHEFPMSVLRLVFASSSILTVTMSESVECKRCVITGRCRRKTRIQSWKTFRIF